MSKYAELDETILAMIAARKMMFGDFVCGPAWKIAQQIKIPGEDTNRVIDRRLQALRKASRIVYTSSGWIIFKEAK